MQPNVLISSAGKRVELLLEFQKELKTLCPKGQVIAVDLNPGMSPACHVADKAFEVPKVTDSTFCEKLLEICRSNNVKVVIPTIDTELQILSRQKERFKRNGIVIMVADENFIGICRDKRKTMQLFEKLDIRNPELRDKYNPLFPMFAKPYDGSLSTNIHVLRSKEDITAEIMNDSKLIFMEYIDKMKYKEFTVDMYYGSDNKVKVIVPRERIEIRSGEVNKGAARKNYLIEYLKKRMGYMPGVIGCICIQLFYCERNKDVVGIEINPRFGGGYPLSYYSGANVPRYIIEEYIGDSQIEYYDDWKDNTKMLRYDSQIIVHE